MRTTYLVSLLATAASLVSAQKMVPTSGSSSFPACAINCPVLLQAQTTCTPPNAIQSTQLSYDNCFCQIPSLGDLYTTGETLCTSQCTTTSDRQLLSTWFASFCKQVGQGIDPVSGTSSGSGGSRSTLSTVTTTASATSTATAQSTDDDTSSTTPSGPWIKTHWQWIIMLLFLFFGLLAIGFGARWLKKRHDRKLDQNRATMSGFPTTPEKKVDRERGLTPEIWGPHQHMAVSKGYQYNAESGLPKINEDTDNTAKSSTKAKRGSRIEVTEVPSKSSKSSSS